MNSRRNFLKKSLAGSAVISLSGAIPDFLLGASRLAIENSAEKVLVVVQLSGGNDGLNTVVPYADDEYYKNRFTLAIEKRNILKINDRIGFHPALRGFDKLLQANQMAVIQGVGYPDPNRSHFESMDLWHTAHRVSEPNRIGWLGRSVETNMSKDDLPAVHFGDGLQPLALRTENKPIPSVRSLDNFRLNVFNNPRAKQVLQSIVSSSPQVDNRLLGYVHESSKIARQTSLRLEKIQRGSDQKFGYPGSTLGQNLSVIAKLIGSGLGTKIYYTTLDGFDTHSNQLEAHQALLSDLGNSMEAFLKELTDQGNDKRVVAFAFSEFGRRVRENASHGTDHGTAAPVFVFGSKVKPGVVGKHPRLNDLDQGDLKFNIDYRRVYSEILESWLAIDHQAIIGRQFKPLNLFG